ncbi:hypothetical protein SLEP1_g18886 [Rubroshorea leprosula]|uniref:Uncharacterized protein n=1 Tax=Rubroshorea leprosula TaxID=152421 RepID=A0AAV5J7Y5_9ROSI|nr:hypothetical protein SLEP1_g18886 [Rubroshorea leprosula]
MFTCIIHSLFLPSNNLKFLNPPTFQPFLHQKCSEQNHNP